MCFSDDKILLNNRKAPNAELIPEINAHYLTMIDFNGKILSKGLPFDEDIINFRYHTAEDFYQSENELLYHPALNDTIYAISEDKINPKYVLNFGNKKLPSGFDQNIKFREFKKKYIGKNKPFAYFTGDYMEIDNKLFFEITYQNHIIICLYSIDTKTLKFGGKLNNDLKNGFAGFRAVGTYKNLIITATEPDLILRGKKKI